MIDMMTQEMELTETTVMDGVNTAVSQFAQTIANSTTFQNFDRAARQMQADETAQAALRAFQQKQQSLQALLMLNAVSPEEREELMALQVAFYSHTAVVELMTAQEELKAICQATSNQLSERLGLPFVAACGPGCSC